MKAIIFSDMHFYNNPSKSYIAESGQASWLIEQLAVAEYVFDIAREENVDFVIHNGDLFHEKTRINVALYNTIWQFFKDKADEGFEIIFNTGNHDMLSLNQSALRPFSKIVTVVTEPLSWIRDDIGMVFIPYGQVERNLAPLDNDGLNILFTHADIAGLKYGATDYESHAPLKAPIFKEWDIVFNGHIHKPQEIGNIVNIGSPMITDWGEVDDTKRIILLDGADWINLPVYGPKFTHFDRLTDKLKNKIEPNNTDYFRVDIDSTQLADPIFNKFNVFPRVTKTKKRELRMKDTESVEEEIERYVEITDTKLNKNELLRLGREIASGNKDNS